MDRTALVTAGNVVVRLPDWLIGRQDCTGNSWQCMANWWTGLHWAQLATWWSGYRTGQLVDRAKLVTAANVVVRLLDWTIGGQDCTGNSWQCGSQATGLANW